MSPAVVTTSVTSSRQPRWVAKKREAGDGALYKRSDGMWVGRVDIPPGPDGKRKVRSVYSKDRATAAEKLRKLQAEVKAGP